MIGRIYELIRFTGDLGRAVWFSREPHIRALLPATFADRSWVVLACTKPIEGGPVYGTPSRHAVRPGERYWIFVEEGAYWLYAVPAEEPEAGLRAFYADPSRATLLQDGDALSEKGFREDKK